MRVLFVSNDRGGCRHYRCVLPAQELAREGHNVLITDEIVTLPSGELCGRHSEDYSKGQRGFDVVVLQRWMGDEAPRVIQRAKAYGQAIINDVDDWFFGVPTSNAGFFSTHPRADERANVNHYRKALAASSALTVSTPYLKDRLEHLGVPIYVLRNAIDLERWNSRKAANPDCRHVGWLGHVSYRAAGDLAQLRGVMGPWLAANKDWRFLHVGSITDDQGIPDEKEVEAFGRAIGVDRDRIDALGQVLIPNLPEAYAAFDIGLAPLEDCPFNRAKSWIKPLEYGAAGVPCIGSDLPEYSTFAGKVVDAADQAKRNGSGGGPGGVVDAAMRLARRPKDWRRHLDELADDEVRIVAGRSARARARELDVRVRYTAWEAVYHEVATSAIRRALLAP